MATTFRFEHTWHLGAPLDVVYRALADVESYAEWWPQVRRIARIDDRSGHAHVRSLLPYTLDLVLTREVEDPVGRVLRVSIGGDLQGWSQWHLRGAGDGEGEGGGEGEGRRTVASYTQEASVAASGLVRLVPERVLRANHSWMMRSGERGLGARLERKDGSPCTTA